MTKNKYFASFTKIQSESLIHSAAAAAAVKAKENFINSADNWFGQGSLTHSLSLFFFQDIPSNGIVIVVEDFSRSQKQTSTKSNNVQYNQKKQIATILEFIVISKYVCTTSSHLYKFTNHVGCYRGPLTPVGQNFVIELFKHCQGFISLTFQGELQSWFRASIFLLLFRAHSVKVGHTF